MNGTGALTPSTECGNTTSYCPVGSSWPTPTARDHYAVPAPGTTTRFASEALCDPGSYCQLGVKTPCTAGRYGNRSGETNDSCSGVCEAGYYCPPGSTSPREQQCGAVNMYCPQVGYQCGYRLWCDDSVAKSSSCQCRMRATVNAFGVRCVCCTGYDKPHPGVHGLVQSTDVNRRGNALLPTGVSTRSVLHQRRGEAVPEWSLRQYHSAVVGPVLRSVCAGILLRRWQRERHVASVW